MMGAAPGPWAPELAQRWTELVVAATNLPLQIVWCPTMTLAGNESIIGAVAQCRSIR